MKFNFRFSNLLGTVYRDGDLVFTPGGAALLSPVGNRISVYDLKQHRSRTLPVESRYNYTTLGLSPDGACLVGANEDGEVHLISMVSQTVAAKLRTHRRIRSIAFSPDGRHFALAKEAIVMIYRAPCPSNPVVNPVGSVVEK